MTTVRPGSPRPHLQVVPGTGTGRAPRARRSRSAAALVSLPGGAASESAPRVEGGTPEGEAPGVWNDPARAVSAWHAPFVPQWGHIVDAPDVDWASTWPLGFDEVLLGAQTCRGPRPVASPTPTSHDDAPSSCTW
ncbi:hypothetical protein [Nocardioides sp. Leaf285]|uniref:hypothetical protein n=1 Tax=Nocardioides sp. Leaf285 TaxID=1736322 RepID=UPI000703274B|nr:hypothetical protein [Nocardioides sp. Leaf285]KQP63171.1 hypothetical protein ASF47_19365 [Nocardioides sp. Leaf285]